MTEVLLLLMMMNASAPSAPRCFIDFLTER